MRIGVDESGMSHVADATDGAATLVAAIRLDDLATAVALAMPGSRSADLAWHLVEVVGEEASGVARDLVLHADALRAASIRYADAENDLAAAARQAPGAA